MYMVVSKWGVLAGREAEAEAVGRKMRAFVRSQPGVEFAHGFTNQDGVWVAVIGYADEAAYNRLVKDENGPFANAAKEHGLMSLTTWVGSDRGEAKD